MAAEPTVAPITDDTISLLVDMVRTAELLAATLECSVSRAFEIQLRTIQVFQTRQLDTYLAALAQMANASTKVQ